MSRIHQIQVQFVPAEDRCLLRFRTQVQAEYRFWLTRRFIKGLWPVLVRLLGSSTEVRQQFDDQARASVLSFQHESAISQGDFQTPYRPAEHAPLGANPLLLVRAQAKIAAHDTYLLSLQSSTGKGIDVTLDRALAHSLSKLIDDAVQQAGWELHLTFGKPGLPGQRGAIN